MDLVLCRPCGRITTELKDLMQNAELLKFYAFFITLKDLSSEQYIQLCVDCEKKLYAAFEFHKTCLSGELLRKIRLAAVKKTVAKPVQIKKAPARPLTKLLSPEKVPIKIENPVEAAERPSISVSNTTKVLKVEPTDDEEPVEAEYLETKCTPEDEEIIKSVRRIGCPICKIDVFQSELEYHMNLHVLTIEINSKSVNDKLPLPYIELPPRQNGKKVFQCQFEGCGAIVKTAIRGHMATHFPELRKHMCSICGATFLEKVGLEGHMNSHANYSPYQCDQCPQRFRRKPHLLFHLRSKHENFRYICKDCGKQFARSSTFKFHVLLKHKGARLICNVCKQNFTSRSSINNHLRQEHQLKFDQRIHFVLPNNEKLVRSARITEEMVFSSTKINENDYSRMDDSDNNDFTRMVDAENEDEEEVEDEEEEEENYEEIDDDVMIDD